MLPDEVIGSSMCDIFWVIVTACGVTIACRVPEGMYVEPMQVQRLIGIGWESIEATQGHIDM